MWNPAWESDRPGFELNHLIHRLCVFSQVAKPLWVSMSSSVKGMLITSPSSSGHKGSNEIADETGCCD